MRSSIYYTWNVFTIIINTDRLILKILLFYTRTHYESDLPKKKYSQLIFIENRLTTLSPDVWI